MSTVKQSAVCCNFGVTIIISVFFNLSTEIKLRKNRYALNKNFVRISNKIDLQLGELNS